MPHFTIKARDETLADFAAIEIKTNTFRPLRIFSLYDIDETVWGEMPDEIEVNESVIEAWGKRSLFRSWMTMGNGARYLCCATIAKRSDMKKPDVVYQGWALRRSAAAFIDQGKPEATVNEVINEGADGLRAAAATFETDVMWLMRQMLDRPIEYRLSKGDRTPRERILNIPAVVTISLSKPILRTLGNGHGGGWRMPEHDCRGHERHYKSGKVVWINGHKRGDPNVVRRTTYRVIP